MSPVLFVIVGLIGGGLIAGLIFILISFLRYLGSMKTSIDQLRIVLDKLSKDNTLADSLGAFSSLVGVGKAMMAKMDKLDGTINLFYKVALRAEADAGAAAGRSPAPPPAGPEASAVYVYDESAAAARETQAKLSRSGVNLTEEREIPASQATGAQV